MNEKTKALFGKSRAFVFYSIIKKQNTQAMDAACAFGDMEFWPP
ncbi:MAG: hypothetical protein ACLVF5_05925 [Lachnospiraceae bacterium]|jgi:hypothetical protein|nr:hypothetical protein [Acutalibacteraceae bacterium]